MLFSVNRRPYVLLHQHIIPPALSVWSQLTTRERIWRRPRHRSAAVKTDSLRIRLFYIWHMRALFLCMESFSSYSHMCVCTLSPRPFCSSITEKHKLKWRLPDFFHSRRTGCDPSFCSGVCGRYLTERCPFVSHVNIIPSLIRALLCLMCSVISCLCVSAFYASSFDSEITISVWFVDRKILLWCLNAAELISQLIWA